MCAQLDICQDMDTFVFVITKYGGFMEHVYGTDMFLVVRWMDGFESTMLIQQQKLKMNKPYLLNSITILEFDVCVSRRGNYTANSHRHRRFWGCKLVLRGVCVNVRVYADMLDLNESSGSHERGF